MCILFGNEEKKDGGCCFYWSESVVYLRIVENNRCWWWCDGLYFVFKYCEWVRNVFVKFFWFKKLWVLLNFDGIFWFGSW